MSIPQWKKVDMEKGKGTTVAKKIELKKSEPGKLNRTIVVNRIPKATVTSIKAPVKVPATTSTKIPALMSMQLQIPQSGDKGKSVFKIPLQAQRDPRLVKGVTNSNNAEDNAQATQPPNQSASLTNPNAGERISVKERLGFQSQQPLFSNLKNTTSFVVQSNSVLRLTAAESSSMASRVSQPIPSISIPIQQPTAGHVNRQNAMQPLRPTPPAFARSKEDLELILPSFATGPQKYEPVFTHLFRTTCRAFMRNCCIKPDCQLEHRFPDHIWFRTEITKMFQASIVDLYENYMCRNQKLFDFYFDDFCHFFGKNMLVDNLKQMVEDCAERKVPFHFNRIIEGLMLTGRSFTKALAELIPAIPCRSIKRDIKIDFESTH